MHKRTKNELRSSAAQRETRDSVVRAAHGVYVTADLPRLLKLAANAVKADDGSFGPLPAKVREFNTALLQCVARGDITRAHADQLRAELAR